MDELIKSSLFSYLFIALFIGLCFFRIIKFTFKKTKNMENKTIKKVLRFGVSGIFIILWILDFVYRNLYPFSLAYYEYKNDIVDKKIGVIENIEYDCKDRINIVIDNKEYIIVNSSSRPFVIIGSDIGNVNIANLEEITKGTARCVIDEGDAVEFKFGAKSKFIFDIYKTG